MKVDDNVRVRYGPGYKPAQVLAVEPTRVKLRVQLGACDTVMWAKRERVTV